MADKILEKLTIASEYVHNINTSIKNPVHVYKDKIIYTTSTCIVEMELNGKQKIYPFHYPISGLSFTLDSTIMALTSKSESKIVFYETLTIRKRRVLKEEQGILSGQFVDNKRFAIITERNVLKIYDWEKSLVEFECNLSAIDPELIKLGDKLCFQEKNSFTKMQLTSKGIEQFKMKDIVVTGCSNDILICSNQLLDGKFDKLKLDHTIKYIDCTGAIFSEEVSVLAYSHSLLLLKLSNHVYSPLKEFEVPTSLGSVAGVVKCKDSIYVYTTLGGIYEFNYSMSETNVFTPLLFPTFSSKIECSTTCMRKPWIFYGLKDKSIALYNYQSHQISFTKQFLENCLSLSLHPSSLYLIASFPEKVTIFEVLHNDLIVFKDINIRWCQNVKFSPGGHLFAITTNSVIQLYDFYKSTAIVTFKGHSTSINELHFDPRDMYLYSTGNDGSLYTWNLVDNVRENDVVIKGGLALKTCWISDTTALMLQNDRTIKEVSNNVIVNQINLIVQCTSINFLRAAHCVAANGTDGKIYFYKYPFNLSQVPLFIMDGHTAPIISTDVIYNQGKLISVCEDNFIYIWHLNNADYVEPIYTDEIVVTREEMETNYQKLDDYKLKTDEKRMEIQYQLQVRKSLNEKKLVDIEKQHKKELEMIQYEHDLEVKKQLEEEQKIKQAKNR